MRIIYLALALICAAMLAALPVQAQIYKCRAPSGKLEYSDAPCAGKEEALSRGSVSTLDQSGQREQDRLEKLRNEKPQSETETTRGAMARRPGASPEDQERRAQLAEKQMQKFKECNDKLQTMIKRGGAAAAASMANMCAAYLPRPTAPTRTTANSAEPVCASDVACPSGMKCVMVGGAYTGFCRTVESSLGVTDNSTRASGTPVRRCYTSRDCSIGYACESVDGNPYNSTCVRH